MGDQPGTEVPRLVLSRYFERLRLLLRLPEDRERLPPLDEEEEDLRPPPRLPLDRLEPRCPLDSFSDSRSFSFAVMFFPFSFVSLRVADLKIETARIFSSNICIGP